MNGRDQPAVDRLGRYVGLAIEALRLAARLLHHQHTGGVIPRLGHAVEIEIGPTGQDLEILRTGATQRRDAAQRAPPVRRQLTVEFLAHLVAHETDRRASRPLPPGRLSRRAPPPPPPPPR